MSLVLGRIAALYRYPVKSMRAEALDRAELGWHGISGDRRYALERLEAPGGFPWLSASRLPALLRYEPVRRDDSAPAHLPTHVRTPAGAEHPILAPELAAELAAQLGAPLRMARLDHGIFDDAAVSVIATATVRELAQLGAVANDARRFRPNVLLELAESGAFREDAWVGGTLAFGEGDSAAHVAVTSRDLRCAMVNLDPDTAAVAPAVLRAVVQRNETFAGVYATVTRTGVLEVGQTVRLLPAPR